jgi:hypothetical protein
MADLFNHQGKLTFLRAHDVGTGWGPQDDFLDVEVVFMLDTVPAAAFGFQLRDDAEGPVRAAMVDLLRDAFVHGFTVSVDAFVDAGKNNGRAFRIALVR